jgi:hypothetical protein
MVGRNRVAEIIKSYVQKINMKYSFGKGLKKGVISVIIFAIPLVALQFPQFTELTIGGLLVMIVNFLKVKYQSA